MTIGTDKVLFHALLDHVRAVVAGAEMFDAKAQKKIGREADKLWTALRSAKKLQVMAELQTQNDGRLPR
jgi:hypothetical protein